MAAQSRIYKSDLSWRLEPGNLHRLGATLLDLSLRVARQNGAGGGLDARAEGQAQDMAALQCALGRIVLGERVGLLDIGGDDVRSAPTLTSPIPCPRTPSSDYLASFVDLSANRIELLKSASS